MKSEHVRSCSPHWHTDTSFRATANNYNNPNATENSHGNAIFFLFQCNKKNGNNYYNKTVQNITCNIMFIAHAVLFLLAFFYWVHTERHTTLVYCSVSCVCFHSNGKWKINFSSKPDENTAIFSSFRFSFNSPNGFLFLHSITHKFTQFVHISAKHSECNEFNELVRIQPKVTKYLS